MTQHSMVTIRLHRIGVILIVIGVLLFAILLFAGGYIAGRVQGKKIALKTPEVKLPALPVPANTAPPATASAAGGGGATPNAEVFTIRAGTYATEADAKAVVARLATRKLDATIEPRTTSEGTNFFVVFAGRFPDRSEAEKQASTLAEEEHLDTTVLPIH